MTLHWRIKRDKLKHKFASISGKDLRYRIGKEKEMLNKLKKKLGKTDEEILSMIIDL
jgi:hypothetical protein